VDIYRVKTWMGHRNIATTMRYAHLAPSHLEELADVLAQGHGLKLVASGA
jgi:site-specific recombinase XerD